MNFSKLNLNTPLLNALNDLGLKEPTIIQEKAFPVIMSGADMIGIAQTGTGKTLAYLLPCLRQWKFTNDRSPQILVVVPTRELAVQVLAETQKLTVYMNVRSLAVYGGTNIKTQAEQVYAGVDVLIATPGRLFDLIMTGTLRLKSVKKFIIDEVDEMLDLGFRSQLFSIMEVLPIKRQNLMFSATLSPEVEEIIDSFFENTKKIEVAPSGTPLENIEQSGYFVPNFNTKLNLLKYLLVDDKTFKKVVVFVSTKKQADTVYEEIENQFHEQVGVIHSNKAQNNRFNTVNAFENGKIRILIATDLIARGIDITDVSHVINFDVPDQPENYINRIGRTGRAEKIGHSIAFVTLKEEEYLIACEVFMNKQVPLLQLPGDVEISDVLIAEEMPVIQMKNVLVKSPDRSERGAAFHEKSEKNKKVNKKIPHAKKMMMKYGKPKTRGQKPK